MGVEGSRTLVSTLALVVLIIMAVTIFTGTQFLMGFGYWALTLFFLLFTSVLLDK